MLPKGRKNITIAFALFSVLIICGLLTITLINTTFLPRLRIIPRDYRSIQEAINEALEGDIIYVKAGIYQENLVINKSLILIGENPKRTLLDGGASDYTILVERGKKVVIAGFTITGGGLEIGIEGRGAGLQIYNSSHVLVLWNYFTGNRMAIYIHTSSSILISENTIYGNREGIYLTGSSRITILENTLIDNPHFGIHLTSSKANKIIRNTIMGGVNGIYLYGGANENEISENLIKDGGMFIIDSSRNIITKNMFAEEGIFFSNSYANIVSGNEVNGEPIIYLERASGEVVEKAGQAILINCENITLRGISTSNIGVGIEFWKTNNSRIIDSDLRGNEVAIYMHSSNGNEILRSTISSNSIGLLLSSSHNNMISDNVFASNLFGIALRDSQSNMINNNLISESINSGILLINSSRNIISENIFRNNSKDLISINQHGPA